MGTPSAKNLMLGAGKLYFNRWDASGKPTLFRPLGNSEKFNFKTEVSKVTKNSSMDAARRSYAQAIKEIAANGSVTLDEYDPANLALALFGEEGVIVQAAKNVTNETYTVSPGFIIKVPYFNISEVEMKPLNALAAKIEPTTPFTAITSTGSVTSGGTYSGTNASAYYVEITAANTVAGAIAGCKFKWRKSLTGVYSEEVEATGAAQTLAEGVTVTLAVDAGEDFDAGDIFEIKVTPATSAYILGTDYRVTKADARGGVIFIPPTSSIKDNTKILLSYQVAEGTFPKVSGATVGHIEGELLFVGDPSYGPCYNGQFWHISLTPNGEIEMIGEDFATFGIDFTCLDDSENHPEDPLYILTKI